MFLFERTRLLLNYSNLGCCLATRWPTTVQRMNVMMKYLILFVSLALLSPASWALDDLAERYVHLALELGEYDTDYVDAYLGPAEWREQARTQLRPQKQLAADIAAFLQELTGVSPESELEQHRLDHLLKNVRAMDVRARMVTGESFSFATEARLIYDVELSEYEMGRFDELLVEIDALVPGKGDLAERVDAFRSLLAIAPDKVEAVFQAAVDECRRRTEMHIELPANERYSLDLVTGTSWGAYNWYQGDNHSLVQVNLDFPLNIDRAVDLGCHEGYPGHHVWNMMVENRLLKERGWIEYAVFPLFSPAALVAEGSGNYGVDLAFPGDDKIRFEREVLFPMAGLDPQLAEPLERLNSLTSELAFARAATIRLYLDGEISRDKAIERTRKYSLTSREKAEKSVRFAEQYRSYVLNYSLGKALVKAYVERQANDPEGRWKTFERILVEMPTASELASSP